MPKNDDDNPEFRLRPRKPPIPRDRKSGATWSFAFRTVMKYARMSRVGKRSGTGGRSPSFLQQCAVRVSYSSNRVAGHWRAHGRYLARENASLESEKAGFTAETAAVDIAATLQEWQSSSDPRLWKLIRSPEFGERVDLQRFARDVMKSMEADLRTPLDWVAVAHFNTEHPHTVQIGHRTEQDAALAFLRQVPEQRLTPLDRIILRRMDASGGDRTTARITVDPSRYRARAGYRSGYRQVLHHGVGGSV